MDTVAQRDSWGKLVAAGDDTRGTLFPPVLGPAPSRARSFRSNVGAAPQAGGLFEADVSNLDELNNVLPSSNNRVVTTIASRCEGGLQGLGQACLPENLLGT
jgi:hypothetical protein